MVFGFFKNKNKNDIYSQNKKILKENGIKGIISQGNFIMFAKSKNIDLNSFLINQKILDEYKEYQKELKFKEEEKKPLK